MTIRYDEIFVKRPYQEFEYTEELIQELYDCSKDLFHFIKHVRIVNPDRGEIPFEPYDYETEMLEKFVAHRFNVVLASRQSGKSTTVAIFALWIAMFNDNQEIGIVSNKESTAKMLLARIKRMYESLPVWLKPGVLAYNKTSIEFDNGTTILVSATSPDALRGRTLNLLICDELAFVPKNQAEEFWAANYPTISASRLARVIVISTPNGMFDIFHRLYDGAQEGRNTFVYTKVSWERVPGRDAAWKEEQLKNLTKVKFASEFGCTFLGSANTVIDSSVLEYLNKVWVEPSFQDFNGKLNIYERPGENERYVIGVDVAKGTGQNYSACQVLKIINHKPIKAEQVAAFEDNLIDVYKFAELIVRLANYYNKAYVMVENNAEGASVVNQIWWDLQYENLINYGGKQELGIRATRATKPQAVLFMKKLIENGSLKLRDLRTISELSDFIEDKNKFRGKNLPDDLVSALYWGCFFFTLDYLDPSPQLPKIPDTEDVWGILVDSTPEEDWSWLKDDCAINYTL